MTYSESLKIKGLLGSCAVVNDSEGEHIEEEREDGRGRVELVEREDGRGG